MIKSKRTGTSAKKRVTKSVTVGKLIRATIAGVSSAMPGVTVVRGVEFVRSPRRRGSKTTGVGTPVGV